MSSTSESKTVECVYCGWHHFAILTSHAEAEIKMFKAYFDTLTTEEQQSYYGGKPSSIREYTHCNSCGRPASMKPVTKTLKGSTIGPIIWESETTNCKDCGIETSGSARCPECWDDKVGG
jgi:hypothetical protein